MVEANKDDSKQNVDKPMNFVIWVLRDTDDLACFTRELKFLGAWLLFLSALKEQNFVVCYDG